MMFLRVLGAILLSAVICAVAGIMKDYFHLWPDAQFQFVWPAAMAVSGAIGAIIMAIAKPSRMLPPGTTRGGSTPASGRAVSAGSRPGTPQVTSPVAAKPLPPGMATSAEVPGMPTFDFDKAQATGSAVDKAQAGQGGKSTP